MAQVRLDLQTKSGHFETNHMLQLPTCMMRASMDDALKMARGEADELMKELETRRMHSIQDCAMYDEALREFQEKQSRMLGLGENN